MVLVLHGFATRLRALKTFNIIGWREYISLPDWGVDRIIAKADTGARSSAVDVADIEELPGGRVRFAIALSRRNRDRTVEVETDIHRRLRVRSSNGQTAERLSVRTTLQVGDLRKPNVEFSLVCRRHMLCRALLGRTALGDEFLVDSLHKFLFDTPETDT